MVPQVVYLTCVLIFVRHSRVHIMLSSLRKGKVCRYEREREALQFNNPNDIATFCRGFLHASVAQSVKRRISNQYVGGSNLANTMKLILPNIHFFISLRPLTHFLIN